jgi:hypothetical protein
MDIETIGADPWRIPIAKGSDHRRMLRIHQILVVVILLVTADGRIAVLAASEAKSSTAGDIGGADGTTPCRSAYPRSPRGSCKPSPTVSSVAVTTALSKIGYPENVCLAVVREAMANDMPAEFFTRLIWQESRFNPRARSYQGAEGIAQFMPATARWRGLNDSYDPFQSLHQSARWLAQLRQQFGNVGLAAAAYNAGPARTQAWLSGRSNLPAETRRYVRIVTGRSAEDWARSDTMNEDTGKLKIVPCSEIARAMRIIFTRRP